MQTIEPNYTTFLILGLAMVLIGVIIYFTLKKIKGKK